MTDSPPYETERYDQTRFSTPVSELDDHRQQPASLPRADSSAHSRRGTVASIGDANNLQRIHEALNREGMTSRDFEHAIAEDDKSEKSVRFDKSSARRTPSHSPILGRRPTLRRPREQEPEEGAKSRASSRSSHSTSPPNSVDAFAEPRRRERTGTVSSKAPDLGLELQRSASISSRRRRGTFSDARSQKQEDDNESVDSSAEEDVCFPQPEETGKTYTIDFEELEEFVAEQKANTPVAASLKHKPSIASNLSKPRVFHDLSPNTQRPASHGVETQKHKPSNDFPVDMAQKVKEADVLSNTEAKSARRPSEAPSQAEDDESQPKKPRNRWTFFSSEFDDAIHSPDLGGLLMPGETFRDLFTLNPDGGVWWLDMLNPTEDEIMAICKAFSVHPLTREDIFQQETREKVELFKLYYFVCFRSFYQDKKESNYLEPINVYACVFREGLLTFTFAPNPHASNVRKRIARLRDYMALSADWICYALIDDIVDAFAAPIQDFQIETDSIEDQVFTVRAEDSRTILKAIGDCRKRVMHLMRLIGGKADVIKGFAKRCNDQYSVAPRGDVGLYLSDIQDHVVTMMSNLAHYEKMLSRSHSNYLAQIQVDNIAQGNVVNETLGKVTLIATILVPLNLITGLFGMNVKVPGMDDGSLAWFFGILGVIATFVAVCLTVAKRMRLI